MPFLKLRKVISMKNSRFAVVRFKTLLLVAAILALIASIVANPSAAIEAAKTGLSLCANILIPSLFPFFVLSGLLIQLGFARLLSRPLRFIMRPLFGISGSGALAFVLGILSGYPLGAACASELYESGACSRQEAERLLAFCNNSGPLFIIGSVGAAMYQNRTIGIALYVTHILAAVTVGILFRFHGRKAERFAAASASRGAVPPPRSFGEILSAVMRNSINNMLLICGFTLIFSVVIRSLLAPMGESGASNFLAGVLELTMGLFRTASSAIPLTAKLVLSAAILGFAGFSVHFQVMGLLAKTDLSIRPYLLGKALQALIGAFYMWLALFFLPLDTPAWAPLSPLASPALMLDFQTALRLSIAYLAVALAAVAVMLLTGAVYRAFARHKQRRNSKKLY